MIDSVEQPPATEPTELKKTLSSNDNGSLSTNEPSVDTNLQKSSLFVGDLGIYCKEEDLHEKFSPFGEVLDIKIMRNQETNRNLSYGFIKFRETQAAQRAMDTLNGVIMHGRPLRIRWATYKSKIAARENRESIETSPVHVSFISYQTKRLVTEESLRILFSKYGEVLDVSIKKSTIEEDISCQSGYGFVHFGITPDGIESAITAVTTLNDCLVEDVNYKCNISHHLGKRLHGNPADPKPTGPDPRAFYTQNAALARAAKANREAGRYSSDPYSNIPPKEAYTPYDPRDRLVDPRGFDPRDRALPYVVDRRPYPPVDFVGRRPPPPDEYYGRGRYPPEDPYARDPYMRDPYARDPYTRDPYARDPRDPYARDPRDPYARDPYARDPYAARDPYMRDPYTRDPYTVDPRDPYARDPRDPYARDPRDPYARDPRDPYARDPRSRYGPDAYGPPPSYDAPPPYPPRRGYPPEDPHDPRFPPYDYPPAPPVLMTPADSRVPRPLAPDPSRDPRRDGRWPATERANSGYPPFYRYVPEKNKSKSEDGGSLHGGSLDGDGSLTSSNKPSLNPKAREFVWVPNSRPQDANPNYSYQQEGGNRSEENTVTDGLLSGIDENVEALGEVAQTHGHGPGQGVTKDSPQMSSPTNFSKYFRGLSIAETTASGNKPKPTSETSVTSSKDAGWSFPPPGFNPNEASSYSLGLGLNLMQPEASKARPASPDSQHTYDTEKEQNMCNLDFLQQTPLSPEYLDAPGLGSSRNAEKEKMTGSRSTADGNLSDSLWSGNRQNQTNLLGYPTAVPNYAYTQKYAGKEGDSDWSKAGPGDATGVDGERREGKKAGSSRRPTSKFLNGIDWS